MFVVWLTSAVALVLLLYSLATGGHHRRLAARWFRFRRYRRLINAIPGPRAYPLIGTTWTMFGSHRSDIPRIMQQQYDEFPRLSRTWMGPLEAHVHVSRAEHMEIVLGSSTQHMAKSWSYDFLRPWLGEGLLTASGEHWRQHRKIITPTFHFGILETFGEIFAEKSTILADKLEGFARRGEVVDVYPLVALAALDIIAEAAMGCEVHAQDGKNHEYVAAITRMGELLLQRLIRPWLYPDSTFALTKDGHVQVDTLHTLHSFSTSVINQRKAALKETADGDSPNNTTTTASSGRRLAFLDLLLSTAGGAAAQLSDRDIREEVDTFMFEGHDTTTSGIAWTLLLLGLHPDWQERIYDECTEIFATGSDDERRPATMADVGRMSVLERCVKESMRLYPPVPNISRRISEDIQLDAWTVPSGTTAIIELVHLHQDERFFPDHQRYDPDRFLPEQTKGRHPFAYLPFSAGARNCIGQKFALFEEKTLISTLVRRYRWTTTVASRHDVSYVYELITRPIAGIPLVFEKR